MRKLAGNNGFGGDLRYGETGDGAGLRGADKICTAIAESSLPNNNKTWKAFLSTTTVNARDRVGTGPWYDRTGRLVSQDLTALLKERPTADAAIKDDLPNETGIPNSTDGNDPDNHDTLTGSKLDGTYDSASSSCSDWTSTTATGKPRIGHSWGAFSGQSWITAHQAGGCVAGVNLIQNGAGTGNTVGAGGGYGGIYCFALQP